MKVYCGGLVRLLADHFLLSYSIRVFLWRETAEAHPAMSEVLRQDCDQLGRIIESLGCRISQYGGRFPVHFGELHDLASFPGAEGWETREDLLQGIHANHDQIITNVAMLRAIVPFADHPEEDAFLRTLGDFHETTNACLRASNTAPPSGS